MPETEHRRAAGVVALLAVLVAAGIPLIAYLWGTLDDLLAGQVDPTRLAVSLPVLLGFLALLVLFARGLIRLTAAPATATADEPVVTGTLFLTALLIMFTFGVWLILYQTLLNR